MNIISRSDAKALGLTRYFTGNSCLRGHVSERRVANHVCVECDADNRKKYYKNNIDENRRKARERARTEKYIIAKKKRRSDPLVRAREYHLVKLRSGSTKTVTPQKFSVPLELPEAERKRIYARVYYHHNKDKIKKYYIKGKERRRVYIREWTRKFSNTPEGACIGFMRKCIRRCMNNKTDRTHNILGYDKSELVARIESNFLPGMTWNNYGEWHIDHIKPISAFIREGVKDPRIINHLSNLRPLWAFDNLSKGKKYNGS